jgi:hypothetical protein
MRYVVMIVCLGGMAASAYIASQWMQTYLQKKDGITLDRQILNKGFAGDREASLRAEIDAFDRHSKAWPFLFASCGLGVLGVAMASRRRPFLAAALMLCAALGPAVFDPYVLIYTSGLALAGLLALVIKPLPTGPVPA